MSLLEKKTVYLRLKRAARPGQTYGLTTEWSERQLAGNVITALARTGDVEVTDRDPRGRVVKLIQRDGDDVDLRGRKLVVLRGGR